MGLVLTFGRLTAAERPGPWEAVAVSGWRADVTILRFCDLFYT